MGPVTDQMSVRSLAKQGRVVRGIRMSPVARSTQERMADSDCRCWAA
jgi:hypothetical protein